jgi:hypothetical protein
MTSYSTMKINTQLQVAMESVMRLLNFAKVNHVMCDNSARM